MQGVFPLVCLCLVISVALQDSVGSSPGKTTSGKRKGTRKNKNAALVQQLNEMKDKLNSLENNLQATRTELESTKSQLTDTKTELESRLSTTKTELESTKSQLNDTKTELESRLSTTKTELESTKSQLTDTKTELESRLSTTKTELESTKSQLSDTKQGQGSTFIRWGRKSCPSNTTLVYSGVAGGKHYPVKGSGTNTLCLSSTPQYDDTAKPYFYGVLYGAEYQGIPGHHDHDVPCSVCLAPQSSTIMVPATLTCPPGWTPQYNGHLASQHILYHATEYVCLDGSPVAADSSSDGNEDGLLLHYVVTVCGSLPCPPFINDKVATCVVCSK